MSSIATVSTVDGEQFVGEPIGVRRDVTGPLLVCTAAMSPLAALSKPEYHGAIVVFTTVHIGGVESDLDGCVAAGVVVREPAMADPAHGVAGLSDLLANAGLVGVAGVDTRALTQMVTRSLEPLPAVIKQYER